MGVYYRMTKNGIRRWYYAYRDPDTGKWVRVSTGSKRKADAVREYERIMVKIREDGTLLNVAPKRSPLFRGWAETYLSKVSVNKKSHEREKQEMPVLVEFFGKCRLSAIRPLRIEGYRQWRMKLGSRKHPGRPIKPATVNRELALLSHMVNCAKREGLFRGENPVSHVRRGKEERRHVRLLSEPEFQRLLDACRPDRARSKTRRARDRDRPRRKMVPDRPTLADFVMFLRLTGCRVGEALNLRVEDVDAVGMTLTFRGTKNGEDRKLYMGIPLLKLVRQQQSNEGYVFGGPKHAERLRQAWKRARVQAGFPELRMHDLRHLAVSWMRQQGVDDPTIMAITGHKTLSMLDRYSHPRQAACKAALAKLAASLPQEADDTRMTQSGQEVVRSEKAANSQVRHS
jgi:integrase